MKPVLAKRSATTRGITGINRVLPQIQALIEASRQHVVATANLTLVWLNWNVGRIISEEIQQYAERAEYGDRLIEALAQRLTKQYGNGYSARSLWDVRRFFSAFELLPSPLAEFESRHILPSLLAESSMPRLRSAAPSKSSADEIRQVLSAKASGR